MWTKSFHILWMLNIVESFHQICQRSVWTCVFSAVCTLCKSESVQAVCTIFCLWRVFTVWWRSAVSAVRVFLVYSYSEVNSLCCVSVCSLFHKATQLLFVANLWVLFCIIRFCSGEHVVNNMSPAEYTVCWVFVYHKACLVSFCVECLWTSITWLLNPPVDMPFPWKSAKQIFCHFRGLCIKVSEAKNECLLMLKCPISNIFQQDHILHMRSL